MSNTGSEGKDNIFVKLSGLFFKYWKFTLIFWIMLLAGGAYIFTNVIQREGFPPIQFPLTIANGSYFVNDSEQVDRDITQPISKKLAELEGVDKFQTFAGDNFYQVVVYFEESVLPETGTQMVKNTIADNNLLPEKASIEFLSLDPASYLNEYDALVTAYSTSESTPAQLEEVADYVQKEIAANQYVQRANVINLVEEGVNPATGETESVQAVFSRVGIKEDDGQLNYYNSVVIGVDRISEEIDVIDFSQELNSVIANSEVSQTFGQDFKVTIGADFADEITSQISSLQGNMTMGILAVAVVSLLLITWRASVITALFMVTVMLTTISILYLTGYTLNTITLFALILALGLFVDDATIIVEAIDSSRKKGRKGSEVVNTAIKKVAAASFAGTATTILVFLPLAFLSGILGEFIRLMPITVIIALVVSLTLSLTIIPFLAKFILLRHTKDSWFTRVNPVSKFEAYSAKKLASFPAMIGTKKKRGRGLLVGGILVVFSWIVIVSAFNFAGNIPFNIFPAGKDSDQIGMDISFAPGTTIEQAQEIAMQADQIVEDTIGDQVTRVSYGRDSSANQRQATILIELIPFSERDVKAPVLVENLDRAFASFKNASVSFSQIDNGPPIEKYPFKVQIAGEDVARSESLALDIASYLNGLQLERSNGTVAHITEVDTIDTTAVVRYDSARTLQVSAAFDGDDTSALLELAQKEVEEKYTNEYLAENNYPMESLGFDFGQESDNADSFSSLVYVFPLALAAMYLLLSLQFRSLLQPLLIFMAIPFSLFGVFAGLYYTDNSLSFFVMVGLISLIGIAVNNTILLTDYANQERRAGKKPTAAISEATHKRFRPLITTSLTTFVALLPLALSDPFWEALSFTIVFGLLSSTFLVVVSFPYYYLAAEWLRSRFNRRQGLAIFVLLIASSYGLMTLVS